MTALAIGGVALTGWVCLAMPFWGDQALFTVYARQLAQGAVLYRDLFDVKQPGIFLFFLLGGSSAGFTETGIHLFELTYWLAFSAWVVPALRRYFATPWGASLVPPCTVAVYYLYAEPVDLTQVEMLAAFPILAAWRLIDGAQPATRAGRVRYATAGFAAAAVVLLKHIYGITILAFLGWAIVRAWRGGHPAARLRPAIVAFAIVLLVPLCLAAAYFAVYGQIGRIWWAYVDVSPAAQLGDQSVLHLKLGARRFLIGHAPILILAAVAVARSLRNRRAAARPLVTGMLLWLSTAALLFAVQNWGLYKWLLFTAPLGVLAAVGLEEFVGPNNRRSLTRAVRFGAAMGGIALVAHRIGASNDHAQTLLLWSVVVGVGAALSAGLRRGGPAADWPGRCALAMAIAVALGLSSIEPVQKIARFAAHDFGRTPAARAGYMRASNDPYRAADADLEALRRHRLDVADMYVFGNPVLLLRADRPQVIAMPGWLPEYQNRQGWAELAHDLRAASPRYVVIDPDADVVIRRRDPRLLEWIQSTYAVALAGASGTWYVRSEGAEGERDHASQELP